LCLVDSGDTLSGSSPQKKQLIILCSFLYVIALNLTTYHNFEPFKTEQINTFNMKDRNGWDGKLRVDDPDNRRAILANPEALEDPDYSDEDAPPVEEIGADEGISCCER
jgi:hypothetical protein